MFPISLASYSQETEGASFSSTILLSYPQHTASHPWTQQPPLFTVFVKLIINALNYICSSAGNIMTRLWAGWLRNCDSIPGGGKIFFSPPKSPDWLWCPNSLLFYGQPMVLSPGGQLLQHRADHSPLTSAGDKNVWNCAYVVTHAFMAHTMANLLSSSSTFYTSPLFLLSSHGLSRSHIPTLTPLPPLK
jgi:hypothetical protein